jgi:hypothetical protein
VFGETSQSLPDVARGDTVMLSCGGDGLGPSHCISIVSETLPPRPLVHTLVNSYTAAARAAGISRHLVGR